MTDADDLPTVVEAAEDVRAGRRSALDLVESCLARIDARNPELNAFVYLEADGARRAAEGAQGNFVWGWPRLYKAKPGSTLWRQTPMVLMGWNTTPGPGYCPIPWCGPGNRD